MTQPPSFPPPRPQPDPSTPWGSYPASSPVGYAAYPGVSADGQSQAAPVVPRTVTQAFVLMLTRSALSLLSLVVSFATRNQLVARVERQQQLQAQRTGVNNPIDPKTVADIGIAVGIVAGLAFLVFYVFLAFKVRRGRQWARVVTWVFAGLGVLGLLTQFLVSATAIARVIGTVAGLLDIAIIVLLALKPTSEFITETTARRRT